MLRGVYVLVVGMGNVGIDGGDESSKMFVVGLVLLMFFGFFLFGLIVELGIVVFVFV